MKKILPFLIIFILIIGFSFTKNINSGFHVTTTKIDYNSASKKISISMKFFTEDIEGAVNKKSTDASFKSALGQYVKSKFKMKVNGASKSLRLTGINASSKTTWGYFEISGVTDVKNIEVNNTMLLNLSGQKNIMNFSVNGQRKSLVGNSSKKLVKATF
ncbi:hypothetical protein UJ101_01342 [Flavobacteriaceae bacterium UJ101]|nr:hypothetical protein UJ101_01342 [Flavobacteriaceae bacterium UJ101]